ncbi:MAG: hypothetical protein ABEH65_00290 [Halobacteriales archaeon]
MTTSEPRSKDRSSLRSQAYKINTDGQREPFYALCIENKDNQAAWLFSDTVCALDNFR